VIGREVGNTLGQLQLAEHMNEKLSICVSTRGGGYHEGDVVTLEAKLDSDSPTGLQSLLG
jgi:hypothetical protein